ncbi:tyrosine-protein phosphatase 10D isoform X2 [Nilaparvata lugens]|uniref:tyrosine-protein phosphatase 10D isoform X2 n=1 Tax=Nilaparvata lugens TaxID=108931 RepID=UPI00193CC50F|nr:tyrosine-protein phosphatase 10D isoform X2 [Nilaparvata lugens]
MIRVDRKIMKILILSVILLISVILFAVKTNAIGWEVKPCPADGFTLKKITNNGIALSSSMNSSSLGKCQYRKVVAQINVVSDNQGAVIQGRLKYTGYHGNDDVILTDDSKIEKELSFYGQMKLFACVEYKIYLDLLTRKCDNVLKFKCSDKELKYDKIVDSTIITAHLYNVKLIDSMVFNHQNYGNFTRFYISISPDLQFCDPVFNFTIYATKNGSDIEMVYETALAKSEIVDVPDLIESVNYTALMSLQINRTSEVTYINQSIPFSLDATSSKNVTDWNVEDFHVYDKGATWAGLAWKPPGQPYTVESYILEIYSENGTPITNRQLSKYATIFNVTDSLEPCSEYRIDLSTISKDLIAFSTVNFRTNVTVPLLPAPDEGHVLEIGATMAVLSWQVAFTLDSECSVMDVLTAHCYSKAGKVLEFNSTERSPNGTVLVDCVGLEPFTEYSCNAVALNEAGESNASLPLVFSTLQDVPSSPNSLEVREKASDSILVSWSEPLLIPGILTYYTVTISSVGPAYSIPNDCKAISPWQERNLTVPAPVMLALIDDLLPYYQYSFTVVASTGAGYGEPSDEVRTITLPNVSETVRNVTINVHYNESVVTWRPPCITNGKIVNFSLKLTGSRQGFGPLPSKHWNISRDENWFYLRDLLPEATYKLSISVIVEDVDEENPLVKEFTSSARVPEVPSKITSDLVDVDPKLSTKPSSEAVVLIKRSFFNYDNGEIRYLALLVSENHMIGEARSGITFNRSWPHMTTWAVASSSQHVIMYQATPKWWNPMQGSESEGVIRYTLGQEVCSEMDIHSYCNGPLLANTLYALRIRVFTSAGFRDSPPIRFKTDFGFSYDFLMSLFLGFFVVTTAVIIIGYFVLSKRQWKTSRTEHKYLEELPAKKVLAHANAVLEHKNLMHSEFLHLSGLSDTLDISSDAAKFPANMPKNRYTNILPYDFNRVVLEGDEVNEYINASYIADDTLKNEVEYVACQAPKESTVRDFWRMIVQCSIRAIVMLCNLTENNKDKCYWYFPEESETLEFGDIAIHCLKKITNEAFIQRFLVIKTKNQGDMKVDHYHFVNWPDFEAPEEAIPMIKLCQAVRADVGLATIAVHCSAGVGRTGTYIAVDMLLRHLNHRKKVSVFRTVLKLRGQRANMVQNEVQYTYIYKVLKHTLDNSTLFFRKGSRLFQLSRSTSTNLDEGSLLSLKVRS